MSRPGEYIIEYDNNAYDLETKVSKRLNDGYTLCGGVSVSGHSSHDTFLKPGIVFSQAMIKYNTVPLAHSRFARIVKTISSIFN